jgi:hypothetical protein
MNLKTFGPFKKLKKKDRKGVLAKIKFKKCEKNDKMFLYYLGDKFAHCPSESDEMACDLSKIVFMS